MARTVPVWCLGALDGSRYLALGVNVPAPRRPPLQRQAACIDRDQYQMPMLEKWSCKRRLENRGIVSQPSQENTRVTRKEHPYRNGASRKTLRLSILTLSLFRFSTPKGFEKSAWVALWSWCGEEQAGGCYQWLMDLP